jgi:hypothetical protein
MVLFRVLGVDCRNVQGFLNVIVYVYSNPEMKTWIYLVLTCQKPWQRGSGGNDLSGREGSYDVEAVVAKSPMFNTVDSSLTREDMLSRDSFTEAAPAQPPASAAPATKGILQSSKPPKNWQVSNLDQEKFVRFGEYVVDGTFVCIVLFLRFFKWHTE